MPRLINPRVTRFCGVFLLILLLIFAATLLSQTFHGAKSDAYVFYATHDDYACSAIVNIHRLRNRFQTKRPIFVLISPDVSEAYLPVFEQLGAAVIKETPPRLNAQSIEYYKDCLLKLLAFKMHEIEPSVGRVLVMDADQLILKDIDSVFKSPPADVSAPPAYWLQNGTLSSTCMLIQPGPQLWNVIEEAIAHIAPDTYDMDLMNQLFGENATRLPPSYATINSHWEDRNVPLWLDSDFDTLPPTDPTSRPATDDDLEELNLQAHIVHFYAIGKPWMMSVDDAMRARPAAHPILFSQWEDWLSDASELCPDDQHG